MKWRDEFPHWPYPLTNSSLLPCRMPPPARKSLHHHLSHCKQASACIFAALRSVPCSSVLCVTCVCYWFVIKTRGQNSHNLVEGHKMSYYYYYYYYYYMTGRYCERASQHTVLRDRVSPDLRVTLNVSSQNITPQCSHAQTLRNQKIRRGNQK